MPRNLRLALAQDLNQVTYANLSPCNQIEQAQPCSIGKGRKQRNQIG